MTSKSGDEQQRRRRRVPRMYVEQSLAIEQVIRLPKPASHHLLKVLRAKAGAAVILFNGDGRQYLATLRTERSKDLATAELTVVEDLPTNTESPFSITLVQGVCRSDKMDTLVRQAVELGVHCIQPVSTRQSPSLGDTSRARKKREHWRRIIISATEQSGRVRLPCLQEVISLKSWLSSTSAGQSVSAGQRLILDPAAEQSLASVCRQASPESLTQATIVIGPESGFDPDEISICLEHGLTAIQAGPRILRTETAGPAVIASLQALVGDFR